MLGRPTSWIHRGALLHRAAVSAFPAAARVCAPPRLPGGHRACYSAEHATNKPPPPPRRPPPPRGRAVAEPRRQGAPPLPIASQTLQFGAAGALLGGCACVGTTPFFMAVGAYCSGALWTLAALRPLDALQPELLKPGAGERAVPLLSRACGGVGVRAAAMGVALLLGVPAGVGLVGAIAAADSEGLMATATLLVPLAAVLLLPMAAVGWGTGRAAGYVVGLRTRSALESYGAQRLGAALHGVSAITIRPNSPRGVAGGRGYLFIDCLMIGAGRRWLGAGPAGAALPLALRGAAGAAAAPGAALVGGDAGPRGADGGGRGVFPALLYARYLLTGVCCFMSRMPCACPGGERG
jgi:hypothetical protein